VDVGKTCRGEVTTFLRAGETVNIKLLSFSWTLCSQFHCLWGEVKEKPIPWWGWVRWLWKMQNKANVVE
jgi:hypothetical protein